MDTSLISHPTVKDAIEAFQSRDSGNWLSLFSEDVMLPDDGRPGDFMEFLTRAIKVERFASIDKIKDDGTSIYGQFHSEVWGLLESTLNSTSISKGKLILWKLARLIFNKHYKRQKHLK